MKQGKFELTKRQQFMSKDTPINISDPISLKAARQYATEDVIDVEHKHRDDNINFTNSDPDTTIDHMENVSSIESEINIENLVENAGVNQPKLSRHRFSILSRLMLFGILLIAVIQTVLGIWNTWANSPYLASLYMGVLLLFICWSGRFFVKEYKISKQLSSTTQMQLDAERLKQSMQFGESNRLIEPMRQQLIKIESNKPILDKFTFLINNEQNDAEIIKLFDETVLSFLDNKASNIVKRYSIESAFLLAASPLAVLDMALILWRNQKMLQEIAACYGITLGKISRLKLIKSIIHNMMYAGATEVAIDLGSQLFSMEMTGKLSARLAQGIGGGLLTARMGYQAMAFCRPFKFTPASKPKLKNIYKEIFKRLNQRFIK